KFTGWYGQGGKAAAPIWGRFMQMVYKDDRLPYTQHNFEGDEGRSYGVVSVRSLDEMQMENTLPGSSVLEVSNAHDGADNPDGSNPDKPSSPSDLEGKQDALAPDQNKSYGGEDKK